MKITTGPWLTRNGKQVWVSALWKEVWASSLLKGGGATGCTLYNKDDECGEMTWDKDGKDIDGMSEWDLVENITPSDKLPCISISEFEKEL